jgi:predicted O-methyltransferase YrrM
MTPRRSHWTRRYVVDRARLELRQRRHRDDPWLTADAVALLDQWLRPTDRCLEWGSGRSTAWLASRTASVDSVEHDPAWAARTASATAGSPGVRVLHLEPDDEVNIEPPVDGPFELVLVDGIHRDRCALRAVEMIAPGGLIVIDNAERYLPSTSRSPEAIGDDHETDLWRRFSELTHGWRRIWTSNGVTDTALFLATPAQRP